MADKPWRPEEDDTLLDLWLFGYGLGTISTRLNRSTESVRNRVWKIASGYEAHRSYHPIKRVPRGGALTQRDIEILEWGLYGEGQHRDVPVDAAHVARVLARDVLAVNTYIESKDTPAQGFGLS